MSDIIDGIEKTKGLIDNIFNEKNFNPKKINFQKKGFEEAQKQNANPTSLRSYFEQLESALLDHCNETNENIRIKKEKAEKKIKELEAEKQLLPEQINSLKLEKTNKENEYKETIEQIKNQYNNERNKINDNYNQQLNDINSNYEEQRNNQQNNYEQQINNQQNNYEQQIQNIENKHNQDIESINNNYNNQINVATEQYNLSIENSKNEFDNRIQEEKNNYNNEVTGRKTEYDGRIKAKQQQIIRKQNEQNNLIETDYDNSKKTIKESIAKNYSKLEIVIESILLIGTTLFLILFYSSAINTALFKDLKITENISEQELVVASIFDPNAIPNALSDSLMHLFFLLLAPIVFLTFGYVLHVFWVEKNKIKKWLGAIAILIISFFFDCLIAFFVANKIYQTLHNGDKYTPFDPNGLLGFDVNFVIIICFGFVVYFFWGILYGTFINKWNYRNPNKNEYINLNKEIEVISKDIDLLENERENIIANINNREENILASLQEEKIKEINRLITEKNNILGSLQEAKTKETNRITTEKNSTLETLQENTTKEMNRLVTEKNNALENLQQAKKNENIRLKDEIDSVLRNLQETNTSEINRLLTEQNTIIGGIIGNINFLQNRLDVEIDRKIQEQYDILIEVDRHRILSLDDRQYFNDFYNGWTNWITIGIENRNIQISLDHNCSRVLTNFLTNLQKKYNWEDK